MSQSLTLTYLVFFAISVAPAYGRNIQSIQMSFDQEKESEELMPTVPQYPQTELTLMPNDTVLIHSVGDSRMVTCRGKDLIWRSVDQSYVDTFDKRQRIHVEDFSTPDSNIQTLSLIFKAIDERDHGNWTCLGTDREKSFYLYVYVPIEFVPVRTTVVAAENEDVALKCEAVGRPSAQINWMFNGYRISDDQRKYSGSNSNTLTISNLTKDDAGGYICKATQTSAQLTEFKDLTIELDVKYMPDIIITERTLLNGFLNETSQIISVYSHFNSSINLTCETDGNPFPNFLWYHRGKIIRHNIQSGDNWTILTVHLMKNISYGDYKCVANNTLGSSALKIQIKKPEKPSKPSKFEIIGLSNDCIDIDIGSREENLTVNPLAITQYRFEIITKNDYEKYGQSWKKHNITDIEARSNVTYIINKLKPNSSYLVRVASINIFGLSDWTEAKEVTTLLHAPVAPTKPDPNSCLAVLSQFVLVAFLSFMNVVVN